MKIYDGIPIMVWDTLLFWMNIHFKTAFSKVSIKLNPKDVIRNECKKFKEDFCSQKHKQHK